MQRDTHENINQPRCRCRLAPVTLSLLLSLTGGIWLAQAAIAPPIAQAYTSRLSVFLDRGEDESFDTLVRRAELVARAGAQRTFDTDVLVTEVIVMVVGESQGITVPILTLQATRNQWSSLPDPRYWSTYYQDARTLMNVAEE